jgi:cysteine-S-conjugate beta-lyase
VDFREFSLDELRARPGRKWHQYGEDVLPAWIAEMDFPVASPIQQALQRLVDEAAYGYEGGTASVRLAQAFADHMRDCFGWHVGSEHVAPVADLVQALFTAVTAFSDRGQGVVLQTPIYPPFLNSVRETGRRVVEHRLIDDGTRYVMDVDNFPSVLDADTRLLLLCNPHNPTGRVFERHELEAIARAVVDRDAIVVADEVHADLVYPGHTHVPFASLGPEMAERTITITSATKAYNIPGLRCGLMHFGSSALRERFRYAIPDRMLGIVSPFGMEATIVAWRECAAWLERAMQVLGQNRHRLRQFVSAELPGIAHHAPEATYLAWLDCRQLGLPMPPQRFFLERARVAFNDGGEFGPTGTGHVRLNFATSASILEDILERTAKAVKEL